MGAGETAQHIQGGWWFSPVDAGEGVDSCAPMDSRCGGPGGPQVALLPNLPRVGGKGLAAWHSDHGELAPRSWIAGCMWG